MNIEQIYTGCLAQGAYYIESNGEAAVIDPLRDIAAYQERAEKSGAKIKYVLETHFHADFVSGHLDLAQATGAQIVYGPNANPQYDAYIAKDGETFTVGALTIKVLHTPGHTMESVVYLLQDAAGRDHAIFTGDTLFLGDVGRPDLAAKSELTVEDLAGHLYDSLHTKILPLPDDVIVYPGHGAGSACGKHMSKATQGTLGQQKQVNYALQPMSKAEFIAAVTEGLAPPPAYFPENVRLNKQGYATLDAIHERGLRALSPAEFEVAAEPGVIVLDTRSPQEFSQGFVPGSINIGLDGSFAPWVGDLIPGVETPLLLVTAPGREEETVTRLARVGYDNSIGYLKGGVAAWEAEGKPVDCIENITPESFADQFAKGALRVVDVRNPAEFAAGHVAGALSAPLREINAHMAVFAHSQPTYVHCQGGYRSMIAASILKARGVEGIVNVAGGFAALKELPLPLETATTEA